MMMISCRKSITLLSLLLCLFVTGCGCGKKNEKDPAQQQVLKITITPEATPTPKPDEVNAAAVVTNGNITMVNGYLAKEGGTDDNGEITEDNKEEGSGE